MFWIIAFCICFVLYCVWVYYRLQAPSTSRAPIATAIIDKMSNGSMTLDQYAEWVDRRWMGNNPLDLRDHYIMATGLPGEVGEVLEMLKKWQRDKAPLPPKLFRKELGDVLYYLVRICTAHGIKPSEIMFMNVEKIEDRIDRGVLHGSGNER